MLVMARYLVRSRNAVARWNRTAYLATGFRRDGLSGFILIAALLFVCSEANQLTHLYRTRCI